MYMITTAVYDINNSKIYSGRFIDVKITLEFKVRINQTRWKVGFLQKVIQSLYSKFARVYT